MSKICSVYETEMAMKPERAGGHNNVVSLINIYLYRELTTLKKLNKFKLTTLKKLNKLKLTTLKKLNKFKLTTLKKFVK